MPRGTRSLPAAAFAAVAVLSAVISLTAVQNPPLPPPAGRDASSRGASQTPRAAGRPDIVIVLTDQQRADAFGAAGAADVRTPAMDRLARRGVRFTQAFAATPQCSPSRATMLTGRYPHRTGVMGNVGAGEGMSGPLDRSLATIGTVFAAAGYDTAYFGKWHLGGTPGDYGFARHNATIGDRLLAREVTRFVEDRRTSRTRAPLLLIVSWLNPHDIYGVLREPAPGQVAVNLPTNLVDDLSKKPFPQRHYLEQDQGKPFAGATRDLWRRYRAFYNHLVETVDHEIGLVLEAAARGDSAPIVVFTADHGDLGGAHGLPYKGPAMYEELVRVPLVISWPGRIRAAHSDALVSLIDLLPTLCDLAGVRVPANVDGLSLRAVLERPEAASGIWSSANTTASRTGVSRSGWRGQRDGSTCAISGTAKSCTTCPSTLANCETWRTMPLSDPRRHASDVSWTTGCAGPAIHFPD